MTHTRAGSVLTLDAEAEASSAPAAITRMSARARREAPKPAFVAARPAAPLSVSQERHWLWEQVRPGTPLLNIARGLRLTGPLDTSALERSLRQIARRHETLRTRIVVDDYTPAQVVDEHAALSLAIVDLSAIAEPEREHELSRQIAKEAQRPFDVTCAPLVRFCLARIAADQHVLVVVANRLIWDEESFAVLIRELCEVYPALVGAETARARELPKPYGEFARRHRAWLGEDWVSEQLEYWQRTLAGKSLDLDLPADRPRPTLSSYRTSSIRLGIDSRSMDEIKLLARRENTTPFSVMLAAFAAVLHRYTENHDIALGTPVSWRSHPELESVIGSFSNTLLLSIAVEPDLTFRELLSRVARAQRDALEHRHLPYEQAVRASRHEQERGHVPPLRVSFDASELFEHGRAMAAVKIHEFEIETGAGTADLSLSIRDRGNGAEAVVEYSCDLFERATVQRLAESVALCLEAVVNQPNARVAVLPMLTAPLAHRVLSEWNDTRLDYPKERMVHELFAARARERPEKPALFFEGTTLSFRELEERSNQLARELIQRGAGAGTFVGICLERGPMLVIGMLAVLKAGAAYLPLDPNYPRDRVGYMLADSEACIVLTERSSAGVVSGSAAEVLLVDDPKTLERVRAHSRTPPARGGTASQLAYVIYTSGSTGRPKGVLLEHRNVVNFFAGMKERGLLEPPGVWLAATSICFDISVLEILGALTHGFEVTLLGGARLGDAANSEYGIASLIGRRGVTHFQCTPSQARMLLADPLARSALARLERLLIGGEALPASLAEQLTSLVSGEVVNMYGPTETAIWSTTHHLKQTPGKVLIGRPIANTQVYVLDPRGEPVPIGVAGELWIGGDGVARGYHRLPELTRERFVPDRFSTDKRARLYRTGDLVRHTADGALEFLGRNDHQVKLRGYRIELGEIEAAILKQSDISAVVVVAREDTPNNPRLVAYVTGKHKAPLDTDWLRQRLRDALPEHMIPAAFVVMDALPLTPNGKVDRKALPAVREEQRSTAARTPPRDELERTLLGIWTHVLSLPDLGVDDNFFDAGGHSLIAVELFSKVYRELRVRMPLSTLFEAPTVHLLAERIRVERAAVDRPNAGRSAAGTDQPGWSTLVPIQPKGSAPPFFCAAGTGGNPMNLRFLAAELGDDQPFYGLQHRGVDGRLKPHQSVEAMAHEYLTHIRQLVPNGPYFVGGFSSGGVAAYELAQQLLRIGEDVAVLVFFDTINPLGCDRSLRDRLLRHYSGARKAGAGYLVNRLKSRLQRDVGRVRLHAKAQLSHFRAFDYRHEAVSAAWTSAEGRYRPAQYPGRVALFKARDQGPDFDGIHTTDASNGWHPFVSGRLEIVDIDSDHVNLVHERHAKTTAIELRRVLLEARVRAER
jgi:amino acid adenylation domain-containing protein